MSLEQLRKNQKDAIDISVDNDFSTGIHYHATGTGKSWIAMYILLEFYKKYPKSNVLWICERKDILTQQFSKNSIRERGFKQILDKYNVLDFVEKKTDKWYDSLNSSQFWGKPFLCIINRCFLTTKSRYTGVKCRIDLVIHDECHSIENTTTQEFYKWLEIHNSGKNIKTRIIGFSATPEKILPLENILSKYSIYDAFKDKVIVPPKIVWIKNEHTAPTNHLIGLIRYHIDRLPYKKIIVWCGMVEECIKISEEWANYFKDYMLCIDFNNIEDYLTGDLHTFQDFYKAKSYAILFCAVKHREGSDIPNIDGCVFMDMVDKRSKRVFIQCMGRVLRNDPNNKKKYGLVIDIKAKSTIELCNRVQYYMNLENIFPWRYKLKSLEMEGKKYHINTLDMVEKSFDIEKVKKEFTIKYSREEICNMFIRDLPNKLSYKKRLNRELDLICEKDLFGNILRAVEILKLTKNIPHITRGSCGSSLVCYLLGISHIDPIKYNISFARFLNIYRDNLPDIDFDFPHYLRDEVFLKLFQKWGNCVARISNHNYYHEKSALREAIRRNGINKFISKYDLDKEIRSYPNQLRENIYKTKQELEGQFRGFSLHCGGIIYFPDGIPRKYILETNNRSVIQQVNLNKEDVTDNDNFKIDILSSRGLSQLYQCCNFKLLDFSQNMGDTKTAELLSSGDNIGITLAETPLMKKALLLVKPNNIMELAICLSIIRPAAKDAKKEFELGSYRNDNIIFDDDAIFLISRLVGCDEDMADKLRRGYCKDKGDCMEELEYYLSQKSFNEKKRIKSILSNLRKYGFCKAHALSYAQLVWQLAYQKAHNPKLFWKSTLKNVKSCYRSWVHIYEARCNGVTIDEKMASRSIYAKQRGKGDIKKLTNLEMLKRYGYWNIVGEEFYPDSYFFKSGDYYMFYGLVAFSRMLSYGKYKKLALMLGVGKNHYIELIVSGKTRYTSQNVIVKGRGVLKDDPYGSFFCRGKDLEFI